MIEAVIFKDNESSVLSDNKAYIKHIYAFDGNIEDRPYSEKFAKDLYASFFFDGNLRAGVSNAEMTQTIANMFNIYNRQIVKHPNDRACFRGSSVINYAGSYRKTPEIYPMHLMALETADLGTPPSKTGTGLIKMCNDRVINLQNSIYVSPNSKYYKKSRVDRQSNTLQLVSISYDERFAKAVFYSLGKGTKVVTGFVSNGYVAFNVGGTEVTVKLDSLTYNTK